MSRDFPKYEHDENKVYSLNLTLKIKKVTIFHLSLSEINCTSLSLKKCSVSSFPTVWSKYMLNVLIFFLHTTGEKSMTNHKQSRFLYTVCYINCPCRFSDIFGVQRMLFISSIAAPLQARPGSTFVQFVSKHAATSWSWPKSSHRRIAIKRSQTWCLQLIIHVLQRPLKSSSIHPDTQTGRVDLAELTSGPSWSGFLASSPEHVNWLLPFSDTISNYAVITLDLLDPDIPCLCKQCRSRSFGFWRSQLIWICTCLPVSLWIYINNLDQVHVTWLAEN